MRTVTISRDELLELLAGYILEDASLIVDVHIDGETVTIIVKS